MADLNLNLNNPSSRAALTVSLLLRLEGQQRERFNSSAPICSHSDSVMELLPARPLSAPAPTGTDHFQHETRSIAPPICPSEEPSSEEDTHESTATDCSYQQHNGKL